MYRLERVDGVRRELEEFSDCTEMMARANAFAWNLEQQRPLFYGTDFFGFNRYTVKLAYIKGQDTFGNLTIDYAKVLKNGLNGILSEIEEKEAYADEKAKEFYAAVKVCFQACKKCVQLYKEESARTGNQQLYQALCNVPFEGAKDYYEACVMIRFLHFALRINDTAHIGLGRFDYYMKPYYDASIQNGVTAEELLELTQLFFIAMNFDTDTYQGVQQGDNGQSIVLGGVDKDGNEVFNELSEICLLASEELKIIDSKINLRVNKNTPKELFERATRLTKQGLGFPQYCNDDIIIPAMVSLGYDLADARNYSVAACWEVIPSACAADIPNIATFNFPLIIEKVTKEKLIQAQTFAQFKDFVKEGIEKECARIIVSIQATVAKNPLLSAFICPCISKGRDISDLGAKYNNYGVHGAGVSNAADSLCAIEQAVFNERIITPEELLTALDMNYVGYEELRARLLRYPKMGNNDNQVDMLASFLMETFSKSLNGKPNDRGGVFRAGSGSAMEYIWSASKVGATADGRYAYQPYACSFSPSLTAKTDGLLSAIQSFTKFDMKKIANGGPFTVELHDTVFRNDEGLKKVALLVKAFIDLGGHQIQLNTINRERLLEAQKYPELHSNLIVRVCGWSGYFNELDRAFQDHIIKRCEYGV